MPFLTQRAVAAVVGLLLSSGALVVAGRPAAADPHGDQVRVDRELARTHAALESASQRVEQAAAQLAEANRLLPGVQRRLADATGVLAGAQVRAAAAARAAQRAGSELDTADTALDQAFVRVDQARAEVGRYSAQAYMGGGAVGLNALLSAQGPADVVAGLMYLDRISETGQQRLAALTRARAQAKNSQNVVAARTRTADAAKQEAAAAVSAAAAAQASAAQAQRDVAALVHQREDALQVARQERAATEARYRDLQAESARITAQVRTMAKAGGPVVTVGMRLPMPVNGWKSSDFGMRFDPFYKVWRLHAGVDLAAPGGAPIRAVAAGRVFKAGWNGGYGNYTCIYHGRYQGKGFATCYAHQSAILVRVGQQVAAGQVVGRVGTTGASTGFHLHFEVRLDGVPVDPVRWLPSCLC